MGRRLVIAAAVVASVAAATVGVAVAQSVRAGASDHVIHVVTVPGEVHFFDFEHDGFGLGDRLAAVGPILDEHATHRVGTAYFDCWIGSESLHDQSPLDCTYILKLRDGDITTLGIDPHSQSDVFFSVTGGTGVYAGASGQAEYIDTATQTDIIIHLER